MYLLMVESATKSLQKLMRHRLQGRECCLFSEAVCVFKLNFLENRHASQGTGQQWTAERRLWHWPCSCRLWPPASSSQFQIHPSELQWRWEWRSRRSACQALHQTLTGRPQCPCGHSGMQHTVEMHWSSKTGRLQPCVAPRIRLLSGCRTDLQ